MHRLHKTATILLALALAVLIIFAAGCKKSSSTAVSPTITPITDDLFPLTAGHTITYTGFVRTAGTDVNDSSTGSVYAASWTVASNSATSPLGGTSNLVIDSTTAPSPSVNSLYVLRTPPTGSSNFSFLQNVAFQGTDTLTWVLVGDVEDGITAYWQAFDDSIGTGSSKVELRIVGHYADQETLAVAGHTFFTYRLAITKNILVDGLVSGDPDIPLATYWFAPGIGPVKMILNATADANGYYREFKSKNF